MMSNSQTLTALLRKYGTPLSYTAVENAFEGEILDAKEEVDGLWMKWAPRQISLDELHRFPCWAPPSEATDKQDYVVRID